MPSNPAHRFNGTIVVTANTNFNIALRTATFNKATKDQAFAVDYLGMAEGQAIPYSVLDNSQATIDLAVMMTNLDSTAPQVLHMDYIDSEGQKFGAVDFSVPAGGERNQGTLSVIVSAP